MARKRIKKEELNEALEMYADYFTEISQTYDELLAKSKKLLDTSEKEVDKLSQMPQGTRGAQHYLSEHLENASSLISQCQSINDSKFKIKKSLIEYAIRDVSGANDGDNIDYTAAIADIVKKEKEKIEKTEKAILQIEENLDDEIDRLLNQTK